MATYLISNAVTWIGLTSFQSGDALIVTPGGALVLPTTNLSDLDVGGPTMITFAGYVALQSLAVDQSVTFTITATGQVVSSAQGAAIALYGAHLDVAGQITAANGTAVNLLEDAASLTNSGQIAAKVAVQISGAGSHRLTNSGLIQGDIRATGDGAETIINSGTIVGDVSLGAGDDRFSGGHLHGDLDMGLGNDRTDARGNAVSGVILDAGGADIYLVDSAQTRISDTGAGRDTVLAWCNFALSDGIEVLTLRGAGDWNGIGNAQANTLIGNSGNNRLLGGGGADRLFGGAGDDVLNGGRGQDTLTGSDGNDLLDGSGGADHLFGGVGMDTLLGGDGADVLYAGAGSDSMMGGTGADRFVFASLSETSSEPLSCDIIADFNQGEDKIDLSAIDANTTNAVADDAFEFIGQTAFTHQAGQLRIVSSSETQVELDANGDGVADAIFTLWWTSNTTLTSADFIL